MISIMIKIITFRYFWLNLWTYQTTLWENLDNDAFNRDIKESQDLKNCVHSILYIQHVAENRKWRLENGI